MIKTIQNIGENPISVLDNDIQSGGVGARVGVGMGMGKYAGMGMASQEKQQELEMKKKAEGEPDLGYIGEFSGMKCGGLNATSDRLACHHVKWKYDDPLANTEIKKKILQNKRKGRHKFAIQRMCMEESPLLCSIIDSDELPKEKDPKCLELNACPEPEVELIDIFKSAKEFYKLLIKAISFLLSCTNKGILKVDS